MQVLSAGHSGVLLDTQALPAQLKAKRTGSVFLGRPNHAPGPGSLVAGWRLRLRCQQLRSSRRLLRPLGPRPLPNLQ